MFAGRGFTAHEHLEDFNLINMNGRLYDPVVGRFLSPDPIVQAPDFTQGFNRYSYALNNPLKYTDPSGYTWWSHFWNWAGEGFDNLGDWMAKNNIQFQVGINMSGSGTVPFANVSTPNGVNASVGYNIENDMPGIGTNTNGFNSFWYPSYNYNAPVENAYASMQKGMNEWYVTSDEGNQTNWGLYLTGVALTAEDVYNTFYHSHTTYTTTRGVVKSIYLANGTVRSARALQYARTSTAIKALGTTGTALMTGVAVYNIRSGNGTVLDYSDAIVGASGLTAGAVTWATRYAIPAVGEGVALYSWTRLWLDLGAKYGPSTWFTPKQQESVILEYMREKGLLK